MNSENETRFALQAQYYSAQFSSRLRSLRAQKGWSLRALADKIAMSPSLINRLERGRANPELTTLIRLQHAFGLCSLEELFGDLPTQRIADEVEGEIGTSAS